MAFGRDVEVGGEDFLSLDNLQYIVFHKPTNMIERFLKAKHWQLFILTIGIPMVFQIILMGVMFSNLAMKTNPEPAIILSYMQFFPVVMISFMAVLFGWHWSVAIGLQKRVPVNVHMKVKKFKAFFFIPLVYFLCIMIFMSITIQGLFEPSREPQVGLLAVIFAIIFPLHLFSMFCILYTLYFVAKTYKTVELQRAVKFSEFAGEFFMIWFFPVGIWIIQPKINKFIE